ncbi:substrate-binding domain-containing protein [Sphingobium sp. CAP-1]|uniref:substrate-binding domain-containing protein n=1 Tax=Sphingobium sp. CAP-1 TaxID=2676077 RepID=UPI0012BB2A1A|nr:substrate-binding domain-containing protein [Sphingobium sp. CAP-1]QGP80481.1 hypothetical protein GL174_15210 [Sphingobium sp. CAP-1]
MLRKAYLLGTAAAFAAASMSGIAGAQTVGTVYGNGASLPAPYFRQAADCYSVKTDLIFDGNPPVTVTVPDFNYTGAPAQDCAVTDYIANKQLVYKSTGSGVGIAAIFSHDPAKAGDISPVDGVQLFPMINYALSETSLGTNDVAAYNNGGTVQGVTVVAPGVTPGAGQYANPKETYGSLIQFPLLIAPVTIAYDPVYKKVRNGDGTITEYSFALRYARADGSGGLRLDQNGVCAIFNGDITNWGDARLKTLNGNHTLRDATDTGAFTVPLQIVGREDSSGTTSLWTRFLANACASYSGNAYADSSSRLPGVYVDSTGATRNTASPKDMVGAVWNKSTSNFGVSRTFYAGNDAEVVGKYTLANGNDGVAKYIDFTQNPGNSAGSLVRQGRIGYVGPDYVLPGVLYTQSNNYNLQTADVRNAAGSYRAPTATSVRAAYGAVLPPESDASGNYVANAACASGDVSASCRSQPQDWVQAASKTSALANPAGSLSYPIVGTSNMLLYSCYAAESSRTALINFLNFYEKSKTINDTTIGLLASAGFQPVPTAWRKAIIDTFVSSNDPNGTSLTLTRTGARTQCQGSGVIGG